MPNSNKAKGTRWESAVRDYLNSSGQDAHRIAQAGDDEGDVHLNGLFTLQCKDWGKTDYPAWVRDAEKQAAASGMKYSAVVRKSRRLSVGEAHVVMTLDQFADITNELRVAHMMGRQRGN